jgi:hypothetical protein
MTLTWANNLEFLRRNEYHRFVAEANSSVAFLFGWRRLNATQLEMTRPFLFPLDRGEYNFSVISGAEFSHPQLTIQLNFISA